MGNGSVFKEMFYKSEMAQVILSEDQHEFEGNPAFYDFIQHRTNEETTYLKQIYLLLSDWCKELNRSGKVQQEIRITTVSGAEKIGSGTITLLKDQAGRCLFHIHISDVTKRKEEERIYRLIAEHSLDIINIHGLDGTYQYVSPSVTENIGYHPEEMLGKSPYEFIFEEDIPLCSEMHKELLEKKGSVLMTYRVKQKDGTYIWVESAVKAILDVGTGELRGIISISRDIQGRLAANELLKKSEKLAVVGRMAAVMAHEIRNPLTPIKGFMQLFENTKEYNEEYGRLILMELDRVESIISEFLTLAKPHNEKVERVQIETMLCKVIQLLKLQAMLDDKRIIFEVRHQEDYHIEGDPASLKQVFINVIQNALDAIPRHTGEVLVSVVFADEDFVCVRVADNGFGIDEERLANLGEPFYSTKEKGVGLGLMVSYKMVENHGGKISVKSEKGIGTEVSVCLPAIRIK